MRGAADTPVRTPTDHVAECDEKLEQKGGRVAVRVVLYCPHHITGQARVGDRVGRLGQSSGLRSCSGMAGKFLNDPQSIEIRPIPHQLPWGYAGGLSDS